MAICTTEHGHPHRRKWLSLALPGSLGVPRPSWALLRCRGLSWASVGLLFSPALPWLSSGLLGSTGLSWALLGQRCKYILRPQADIDMQPRIVEPLLLKPFFPLVLRKMACQTCVLCSRGEGSSRPRAVISLWSLCSRWANCMHLDFLNVTRIVTTYLARAEHTESMTLAKRSTHTSSASRRHVCHSIVFGMGP